MVLIEWEGCHFGPWYKPLTWEMRSQNSSAERQFLGPLSRPSRCSPSQSGKWLAPVSRRSLWIPTSSSGLENCPPTHHTILVRWSSAISLWKLGLSQESCLIQRPSPVPGQPASGWWTSSALSSPLGLPEVFIETVLWRDFSVCPTRPLPSQVLLTPRTRPSGSSRTQLLPSLTLGSSLSAFCVRGHCILMSQANLR